MKVVTFGEIMLRLGTPSYLRLNQCDFLEVSYAGSEANVSVSLANYGIPVEFVTSLPDNPISIKCLEELRGKKVNVDNVVLGGERIGLFYLETGSVFRPSRVFYDRLNSSFSILKRGDIDWGKVFDGATWFHWTGITPALSRTVLEVLREALDEAYKRGLTISCDINYRSKLWKYGKLASDIMPELISKSDIIIGNEEDFEKVLGIKPYNFNAGFVKESIKPEIFKDVCLEVVRTFSNCKNVAISLRSSINANINTWAGVLYDGKTFYKSTAYNITHIVDRVGGGDSFTGALIYGLLTVPEKKQYVLDFAVAASCLKHTIKGDYNQVSVEEIDNLIKGNVGGRINR